MEGNRKLIAVQLTSDSRGQVGNGLKAGTRGFLDGRISNQELFVRKRKFKKIRHYLADSVHNIVFFSEKVKQVP